MDAGVLATVLLIVGLFLIALELMIPSFGIIGIAAFICLIISLWSAGQAWWGTAPRFFWTFLTFLLLGVPGVMGGMLFVLQTTALGKRVILQGQTKESLSPLTKVRDELSDLVGQHGKSASLLSPGGMVEVAGRRYHAESVGMMVDPDADIIIVGVRGTRVVVRPLTDNEIAEAKNSEGNPGTQSSESEIPAFLPESAGGNTSQDKPLVQANDSSTEDDSSNETETPYPKSADTVAKSKETEEDILDFQIPE